MTGYRWEEWDDDDDDDEEEVDAAAAEWQEKMGRRDTGILIFIAGVLFGAVVLPLLPA